MKSRLWGFRGGRGGGETRGAIDVDDPPLRRDRVTGRSSAVVGRSGELRVGRELGWRGGDSPRGRRARLLASIGILPWGSDEL